MKIRLGGIGFLVAALALFSFPIQSQASTLRCGPHLIQGGGRHGPSDFEVLRKCGEPSERSGRRWLYRSGGSKWELTFNGAGILLTVRQL